MLRNKIINLTVRDVRFPTSLEQHGSDAMVRTFNNKAILERQLYYLDSAKRIEHL